MKITIRKTYIDNSLDKKIREIGIRKIGRLSKISPAYICDLLKGKRNISERLFNKLRITIEEIK